MFSTDAFAGSQSGLANTPWVLPPELTTDFVTTWQVADGESITIPTTGTGYNYTVVWGDGTYDEDQDDDASHTYTAADNYEVCISGAFPRIYFNNASDREKIIAINQWGNQVWTSMEGAFRGTTNLAGSATDIPDLSMVENMNSMFLSARAFSQNLGNWYIDVDAASFVANTAGLDADISA